MKTLESIRECAALGEIMKSWQLTPSEPKKQDSRHRRFMELIFKAHKHYVGVPPMMGAPAGKNLSHLLRDSGSHLTENRFVKMLQNYHLSDDHCPADSPVSYILKLPKYELGPLNKFGRLDASN